MFIPIPLAFHLQAALPSPPSFSSSSPNTSSRRTFLHLLSLSAIPLFPPPIYSEQPPPAPFPAPSFTSLPCPPTHPLCQPVEIYDYRIGTGREAVSPTALTIRWTGRLADRYGWPIQKDDAADDVVVVLGSNALIEGFEMGITGMREGGKRRIVIPAEFGYLDQVKGPLPNDFGDRRRLFATVLNPRRFKKAGELVIDVQLKKVRRVVG